jgi:hypothetical protein
LLSLQSGQLRLVFTCDSTILKENGEVMLNAYVFNDGDTKTRAPDPSAGLRVIWRIHNTDPSQEDRDGEEFIIATHNRKRINLSAHAAVKHSFAYQFDIHPGDIVECYVQLAGESPGLNLRSNSVLLYRPREGERFAAEASPTPGERAEGNEE